jgi:hypothetical protein
MRDWEDRQCIRHDIKGKIMALGQPENAYNYVILIIRDEDDYVRMVENIKRYVAIMQWYDRFHRQFREREARLMLMAGDILDADGNPERATRAAMAAIEEVGFKANCTVLERLQSEIARTHNLGCPNVLEVNCIFTSGKMMIHLRRVYNNMLTPRLIKVIYNPLLLTDNEVSAIISADIKEIDEIMALAHSPTAYTPQALKRKDRH